MSVQNRAIGKTRRSFLRGGLGGVAGVGFTTSFLGTSSFFEKRAVALPKSRDLTITKVDRIMVQVPFRETPARSMAREIPHWQYSEIFRVHLANGVMGVGETLYYYTWKRSSDAHVEAVRGKSAAELMWNDDLGAGLQMALFDAVAKSADVPIHRLLGAQIYERTPLSWWNIDTSAEDMAAECQEAFRQGYMAYKTKGRPWFDIHKQMDAATAVVPPEFKIDMDFNDTLLDARRAIPILKDLESYPQTDIFESPIFQGDIPGNQAICRATRIPVAFHYGRPPVGEIINRRVCDGFVVGGGATKVMAAGHVAAEAKMPFWLQLVGTGITAAYSLHFGAVLRQAIWPAVNCHQLFVHPMLTEPIRVSQGFATVPTRPGLGYEIDWEMVDRFRTERPAQRPNPARLLETSWPTGKKMYVGNTDQVNYMLHLAQEGKMPFYEAGAETRLFPNDGSPQWRELHERARRAPVFSSD